MHLLHPGYVAVLLFVLCEPRGASETPFAGVKTATGPASPARPTPGLSVDGLLPRNSSEILEGDTTPTTTSAPQQTTNVVSGYKRVCPGSTQGLAHPDKAQNRYDLYRTMYSNCTYVDGNLELVFVDEPSSNQEYDLSFLQDIREVAGYVLIVANFADYIPLANLRIIRGRTLFEHERKYYSLYVALNFQPYSHTVGLKELRFRSLHEILAGSVFIFNNNLLCYEDTVNWSDILTGEGAEVVRNDSRHHRRCGECHKSCEFNGTRHCWGEGPEYCQRLTRVSCSPQCDGRCFGSLPNQCCHSECAGGCSGPSKSECWACKNFENEGMCENFCPPEFVYSPQEYRQVPNPRAKYAYGSLCVDKCPSHLIADKGACVKDCGAGRTAGKEGKCVECEGLCPKSCKIELEPSDFINSGNINLFAGCTVVHGSIKILDATFTGDKYNKIRPMKSSNLSVLETVQEVSDFVLIQANTNHFRNLSFLKNLRIVHGRKLDRNGAAVQIFKTSLEVLGFESLQKVKHGAIYIANNSRLCYAGSVNWEKIRDSDKQKVIIDHNRNDSACAIDNEVCHAECTSDGCWGPVEDQCISCRHFRHGKRCVQNCTSLVNTYSSADSKECEICHLECLRGCSGPGNGKCNRCKNARDGPYCIPECPMSKYKDENGICQPCHANCFGGCSGPRNNIGPGGCRSCGLVVFTRDRQNITGCLPADAECEDGFYQQMLTRNLAPAALAGKQGCMMCHPECRTCVGLGLSFCTSCRHYRQEDKCVPECTSDHYVVPGESKCQRCDPQCLSCTGPSASECLVCKLYKVYADFDNRDDDPQFNCTEKCPDFAPHKITMDVNGEMETVCVAEDSMARSRSHLIVGVVCGAVTFIALLFFGVAMLCHQRAKAEATKIKLTAKMTGIDEAEPLKPTNVKPNMSMLRLVKESELRCGVMIGSGAFGMVYKGLWIPEGENLKIPVAIKVLQKGSSGRTEELLEEAHIMASVVHPSCVKILCVCLTAQIMLITQLMPLGCLLEYVRKNRNQIGSSTLLNWCAQIAKGMSYLESRGIVHCDLAARNVLVQSPRVVKITDFGLAKMLDYDHDKYFAEGRKMPIKWLALESILYRIFTHKSDVWSFGVTLWELFTFGGRPYDNIYLHDIPTLLEKGERLHQPSICTLEVYMLMIKCWMLDVDGRPSFRELAEEFSKMARDPGRYLSIPGDPFLRTPSNSPDGEEGDANHNLRHQLIGTINQSTFNNGVFLTEDGGRQTEYLDLEGKNSFSGLEKASNLRQQQLPTERHDSFRYCSDPCKQLADHDHMGRINEFRPCHGLQDEAPHMLGSDHKMSLYEDDYLLPKSSKYPEPNPAPSKFNRARQEAGADHWMDSMCALNPEYFLPYPLNCDGKSRSPPVLSYVVGGDLSRTNHTDCTELKLSPVPSELDYYNEFSYRRGMAPLSVIESPI